MGTDDGRYQDWLKEVRLALGALGTLDWRERECRCPGGCCGCRLWERRPGPPRAAAARVERAVGGQGLGCKGGRALPTGRPSEVTPLGLEALPAVALEEQASEGPFSPPFCIGKASHRRPVTRLTAPLFLWGGRLSVSAPAGLLGGRTVTRPGLRLQGHSPLWRDGFRGLCRKISRHYVSPAVFGTLVTRLPLAVRASLGLFLWGSSSAPQAGRCSGLACVALRRSPRHWCPSCW